ncbi:glycoside hydrolase family 65 protein [Pseudomonas typographi]|uniref:glycoside hydrolase family 65 protein n=1 Tax=Pseudomonas typographi TaxID=2715964 RepID=UPI0016837FF3|nr:glycoside hydrolase family 65 protein [Pseudomonas typographi]MBD1587141.1 glycoside hydrolase family 65 protein [Pseudomonas typographi]
MTDTLLFDHFDPADERRREALMTLSNGVLSLRASAPERADGPGYPGLYLAGWYDSAERQVNGSRCHIGALVNLPAPLGLSLSLDRQQWLEPAYTHYRQCYDAERCEVRRRFGVTLGEHALDIEETRLVSYADPRLVVLRWAVTCPQPPSQLWLRSTLQASGNTLIERNLAYEGQRLAIDQHCCSEHGHSAIQAHLAGGARVVMACHTSLNTPVAWHGPAAQREGQCPWPAGGVLVIEKRILVEAGDRAAHALAAAIPGEPFEQLRAAHYGAWRQPWQAARVRLTGASLQRPLDFALAHVLQTVTPLSLGRDLGFPARGWQEGYMGQIFWDELFAFPFLASHFPERARNLLAYRYRRLGAARARARAAGFKGALYPWRSTTGGEEQTPPWLYYPLSGHWVEDATWLQRHIGAAIAYDAWLLYLATGDQALLTGMAGEIILEVARCWASMARFDASRGRYVIEQVIGPDEYHSRYPGAEEPGVNNNAYTNLMAAWTLCRALQLLQQLPAAAAAELCGRLALEAAELALWEQVSRQLYLPYDEPDVLGQFEGFDQLQTPPPQWLQKQRPRLDWMLEAQGDSTDRYQLTKQPDVLTLLHLLPPHEIRELLAHLGYPPPSDGGRRAVQYHLARITHESSLSYAVCAGAMAHIDLARSWWFFGHCLGTDIDAGSDSGTVEGVHLAAMAGTLDVLQRHYLGLRPALDGLHLYPAVPAELGEVMLRLQYRGQWLEVRWRSGELRVQLAPGSTGEVMLVHRAGRDLLVPGATWRGLYP